MAGGQTAGRGQGSASWFASAGLNVTCSVIKTCSFLDPSSQFQISMATSLACTDFLHHEGINDAQIKWPNDIYSGGRKLAGFLIENAIQGSTLLYTVIGLGLNVNEPIFPAALPRAVSMKIITGRFFDLSQCMDTLLQCFDHRWAQLQAGGSLQGDYLLRLMGFRQQLFFEASMRRFEGVIEGVSDSGELLVREGEVITKYRNKEVEFLTFAGSE